MKRKTISKKMNRDKISRERNIQKKKERKRKTFYFPNVVKC